VITDRPLGFNKNLAVHTGNTKTGKKDKKAERTRRLRGRNNRGKKSPKNNGSDKNQLALHNCLRIRVRTKEKGGKGKK